MISFVVVVGWLKVAQKMLDPYADGEDDVRFDLHWVLHRNVEGMFYIYIYIYIYIYMRERRERERERKRKRKKEKERER